MPKQEKIKQTDYTIGGRDISNTAIPLYQEGLTQLGDYNRNIQNRLDPYMKYVDLQQASDRSDFLRDYQRAMGQQSAQNYAATGGGYSSANQLGYDDLQTYYNRLAANLYNQGISTAEQMAQNEWSNLYNSLGAYNTAYGLGENYSNIDQYNDMVDKANSNSWTGIMDSLGNAGIASGNPWAMAIGAAMKGTAAAFSTNAADVAGDLRGKITGQQANRTTEYTNNANLSESGKSLGNTIGSNWGNWLKDGKNAIGSFKNLFGNQNSVNGTKGNFENPFT